MTHADKRLIILTGPTGVGKSAYAMELAQRLSTPIISADSRQIYKGMSIGTDAPSREDMRAVPHYFVATREVTSPYNAYDFASDALELVDEIHLSHDTELIVGGSMMYIQALLYEMDPIPEPDPEVRRSLWECFETEGIEPIRSRLAEVDPLYLATIDGNNHKRMIRALEVWLTTHRPFSSWHTHRSRAFPYEVEVWGIFRPREILYERINKRVDQMLERGLVDEVRRLLPYRDCNALNTIGYKEVIQYLDGQCSLDEAIHRVKKSSRVYARKQITFFGKIPGIKSILLE